MNSKLSEQQRQSLLQQTRNGFSQAQINLWLTQSLGLSFREAHTERKWAIEQVSHEPQQTTGNPSSEEAGVEAPQEAKNAGRATKSDWLHVFNRNPSFQIDESHEETECVTCGDPTFWCDCTCKRFSDIPF